MQASSQILEPIRKALLRAREQLEMRAEERIGKLKAANEHLCAEIRERKHLEKGLRESREALRILSNRLQTALEEEKKNISREIHDELGQSLTVLKLDLVWVMNKVSSDRDMHKTLSKKLQSMVDLLESTGQRVQRISSELRLPVLDALGLCDALKWQVDQFQEKTGIPCELDLISGKIDLDPDRSTAFFRIFQETLTNVVRHADATRVWTYFKKDSGGYELMVRDNGRGIRDNEINNIQSIGLVGIRERARQWGGEVEIKGVEGRGTTMTVRIPFQKDETQHRE